MTEHPLNLVRNNPERRSGKHYLGTLDSSKFAKHLELVRTELEQVDALVDLARPHIPGLTGSAVVRKVLAHNPDCLWTILRKRKASTREQSGEGFIAIIPLNQEGLQRLALNSFNGADPDLKLVAKPGEKPAGIYMWAMYAPGRLAGAIALLMNEFAKPPYDGVSLFSRPNTDEGLDFNETLGLKRNPTVLGIPAPHLYKFDRKPKSSPLYDGRPGMSERGLTVTLARTFDDMMRMVSIRSAVYIGEQECPYDEEFDGNDMSATHLIGWSGHEPIGCIRVRYFGDFAKIERLAVRKEYRSTRMSFQLVRAAIELCQMKGYRKLYGHAQKRLVNFWSRFGFHELEGGKELVFSDFDYVEMVADIQPHPEAIAIGDDPYRIIRPEGRWHITGVLESSAVREVTRPSLKAENP